MLKYFKAFAMIAIIALGVLTVSCQKNDLTTTGKEEIMSSYGMNDSLNENHGIITRTTYYSTPNVGGWTSPGAININGSCGYCYYGGNIKAQVYSQSGSYFTIKIKKNDDSMFIEDGTAYVKVCSVCGTIAGQQSYNAGDDEVYVTVQAYFPRGYVHFYPVTISNSTHYRSYAEPILIYTNMMYDNSNWVYGYTLGTANGVDVKCNGNNTNLSTNTWQCTEFCIRYYNSVYGKNYIHYKNAGEWFSDYKNFSDLTRYYNEGSVVPRPGDILCMSNSGNGHVAIIVEVQSNKVIIAHQNSGIPGYAWQHPIGGELTYSSSLNKITPPSGYTIQGWMRAN